MYNKWQNGLVVKDNALINASYNLELSRTAFNWMLAIINAKGIRTRASRQ